MDYLINRLLAIHTTATVAASALLDQLRAIESWDTEEYRELGIAFDEQMAISNRAYEVIRLAQLAAS